MISFVSSTFPQDELTVCVNKIAIWENGFDVIIQCELQLNFAKVR